MLLYGNWIHNNRESITHFQWLYIYFLKRKDYIYIYTHQPLLADYLLILIYFCLRGWMFDKIINVLGATCDQTLWNSELI